MKKIKLNKEGLTPGDPRISDYKLYSRGKINVPERFYDHILINIHRPFDHSSFIKEGFYLNDINRVINRFDGISFSLLGN